MTIIQEARLQSVEPITSIVGMTENGDMLIEDRNGVRYSLKRSLLDDYGWPGTTQDEVHAEEFKAIVDETIAPPPEPAPKPKRFRKKK